MFEQCKTEFISMVDRIEAVIKDKWPETLRSGGEIWTWADQHQPDHRAKLRNLMERINTAWANGIHAEVKQLSLEWGKLQMEIFRGYALYLKQVTA